MRIENKCVVTFEFRVKNESGDLVDASPDGRPMSYVHGAKNIVTGLEKALEGKAVHDEFEISLEPKEAYGDFQSDLVQEVPVTSFPETADIKPGMRFSAKSESGDIPVTITAVTDEHVTVDANHPLAGQSLRFEGKILSVREASEDEVQHGQVH